MFRKRFMLSRRSKISAMLIATALLLAVVIPAAAVTFGEPDGDGHPHVGLMVFDVDGAPAWRCSGTLLSPTVMLTAGHCTFGTSGGRVWFEADVESGIPGNGYPFGGVPASSSKPSTPTPTTMMARSIYMTSVSLSSRSPYTWTPMACWPISAPWTV